MTWEGYCRTFGILSHQREKDIKAHEVCAYEERSTWESE